MLLGTAPDRAGVRDATHVAMVATVAPSLMRGGTRVDRDGNAATGEACVGIVDPFVSFVKKGDLFWLCLFPGSVTGMRHAWKHPDFGEES